jgi:plastocyanin
MLRIERPAPGRRTLLRALAGAGALAVSLQRLPAWAEDAPTQVMIDNFTFSPTPLRVKAATTVTWTNRDDIPHSIVCPALNLHSHALDTGDSFEHRFEQTGTYDYLCGIHPHMHGQIIVT